MTTIAIKDGYIAADSQLTGMSGGAVLHVDKLFKGTDGVVYGGFGDWSVAHAMIQWLLGGSVGDAPSLEDGAIVKVGRDGVIYLMEDGPTFFPIKNRFAAFGSGSQEAMMAMRFGASAEEAVKAVIEQNAFSGEPTLVMRYD